MNASTLLPFLNARECGASGSAFEARATTTAGSSRIEVDEVGDFQPGQWVVVSNCHVHYPDGVIYGAGAPWEKENQAPLRDELEVRGFNGERTGWQTFVLHIEQASPLTFSWLVADHAFQPNIRRWTWQGRDVAVTGKWQALMDGVEIRFSKQDWQAGQVICLHARNRLVTRIECLEERVLRLALAPNLAVRNATVRHLDQFALQAAIDRAILERRSLFVPSGRYRLTQGLRIIGASLRLEGESAQHTVLDISDGAAAVFTLRDGKDVAIRNLGMVGHTGFNELPWYSFRTKGGYPFWPTANQQMECKGCAAANIMRTERVLVEDVQVSRMASEAFYSNGRDRFDVEAMPQEPGERRQYTKGITYHRCTVIDSASNAFNNNDFAENTSILNCHIEKAHNAWEGANRFVKFIGNYVRHAHCGSYVGGRTKVFNQLSSGKVIIADNIFEGGEFGQGLYIGGGATEIVVANNLFVNFSNNKPIQLTGATGIAPASGYPTRTATITGNIIDLTHVPGQLDWERVGIAISASNVIVAGNQIYVRGALSPKVTGIQIAENAVNVNMHDNLIENCAYGIRVGLADTIYAVGSGAYEGDRQIARVVSEVREPSGPASFYDKALFRDWDYGDQYRDWIIHWLGGGHAGETSVIERFDSDTRIVTLKTPLAVKAGDRFAISPRNANWLIHHNTINGCKYPVMLEGYGSLTSRFTDNVITRGAAIGVERAVRVAGHYRVAGNQIVDFNEPGARGIEIVPDASGKTWEHECRDNEFIQSAGLTVLSGQA